MARSPSRRTSKFSLSPEEREQRLNEASNRMEEAVKSLTTSDQFRAALRVSASFPEYSFGNTLMIWTQNPEASMVCGFEAWKKLGRHVKKGGKAIRIFVPMTFRNKLVAESSASGLDETPGEVSSESSRVAFRLGNVFDISSTEGEPIPELPRPKILEGDSPLIRAAIAGLCDFNATRGVPVSFTDIAGMSKDVNGFWHPIKRRIEVRESLSPLQRLKTLAHETAHARLHLVPLHSDQERRTAELEAEASSYLVLDSLGIDGAEEYSFPYLAGYSTTPESILGVGERARKAAAVIIDSAYYAINQQLGTEFVRGVPLDALEARADAARESKAARLEGKNSRDHSRRVSDAGETASVQAKATGLFIAIEGVDGIGKSTVLPILAEKIEKALGRKVVCVREPGGTPIGDEIRTALKAGVGSSDPHHQLAMFCTARKALIEQVVRPEIQAGSVVIADRHSLSTYIYQGGSGVSERQIADANAAAVGGTRPDATVVLWATREDLTARRLARNAAADAFDEVTEDGTIRALERQARYVALANRTPGAMTVAVQATPEATASAVVERLAHVLAIARGEAAPQVETKPQSVQEEDSEEVIAAAVA